MITRRFSSGLFRTRANRSYYVYFIIERTYRDKNTPSVVPGTRLLGGEYTERRTHNPEMFG